MTDLDTPEQLNEPTGQAAAMQPGRIFSLLCERLLEEGTMPTCDPEEGAYCEVPTKRFGVALITDAGIEESHQQPEGRRGTLAPRQALLAARASILTIHFPDLGRLDLDYHGPTDVWYIAAKPAHLHRDSQAWKVFDLVRARQSPHPYRVSFFNDKEIESSPAHNPFLRELGQSL